MKKVLILIIGIFIILNVNANLISETEILNSKPEISIDSFSRYNNRTDNFQSNNFTICQNESDKNIFFQFLTEDKNGIDQVINNGYVKWKLFLNNEGEFENIDDFGNYYKNATFEEKINNTFSVYIDNFTLNNSGTKQFYSINSSSFDSFDKSFNELFHFSLIRENCIRVDKNENLISSSSNIIIGEDVSLKIFVDENITGRIIITTHYSNPIGNNYIDAIDKYITVDIEGDILQETINLTLQINYTQADVEEKGLNESTLGIYKIEDLSFQSGFLNTDLNYVNFILDENLIENNSYRLGTYGIFGDLLNESSPPTPPASKSSGGGGGNSQKDQEIIYLNPSQSKKTSKKSSFVGIIQNLFSNPKQLFDIGMNIEKDSLEVSNELESVITFESFGEIPTRVNLTFEIYDLNGNLLYQKYGYSIVETEKIERYSFDDLILADGEYNLVLKTIYGENIYDEFEKRFNVGKERSMIFFKDPFCIFLFFLLLIELIVIILQRFKIKKLIEKIHSFHRKRHGNNIKKIKKSCSNYKKIPNYSSKIKREIGHIS